MATAAAILPLVLSVGGTMMSAFGQMQQGRYAQQMAQYNATIAEQQAAEKAQAAKSQAFNLSEQRRQMIGKQAAMAGAAGLDVNSGSPLALMAHTASEYERDIQYAGIAADQATQAGYEQAQLDLMQGKQAAMAGWIGAGSTLFSGLGSAGMNAYKMANLGGN